MCVDTYFHLLEQAEVHAFDQCSNDYEHVTSQFDQSVYKVNAARTFAGTAESYQHWLQIGRSKGLPFAKGSDTLLKIVLKCKDDTEYIQTWIEYHAKIVGYHNIVVIDCGSIDLEYWNILSQYLGRVLVLAYPTYYDRIHDFNNNRDFFDLIAKNAKYVSLLDADEFMFGVYEGRVSAQGVRALLKSSATPLLAGTWFNSISSLPEGCDRLSIDAEIEYAADRNWISWGSVAGKAIVRTDRLSVVEHIGHNLTSASVARSMEAESFGTIGILHINRLSRPIEKKRALRHLRSKGLVALDVVDEAEISKALVYKGQTSSISPIDAHYIKRYLSDGEPVPPTTKCVRLSLSQLLDGSPTVDQDWSDFQTFDFEALVRRRRAELGEAAGR